MKPLIRKIILRASLTLGMLSVCVLEMHTVYQRLQAPLQDNARPVSAQPDLVIVLDAGHGEATYTESIGNEYDKSRTRATGFVIG